MLILAQQGAQGYQCRENPTPEDAEKLSRLLGVERCNGRGTMRASKGRGSVLPRRLAVRQTRIEDIAQAIAK